MAAILVVVVMVVSSTFVLIYFGVHSIWRSIGSDKSPIIPTVRLAKVMEILWAEYWAVANNVREPTVIPELHHNPSLVKSVDKQCEARTDDVRGRAELHNCRRLAAGEGA